MQASAGRHRRSAGDGSRLRLAQRHLLAGIGLAELAEAQLQAGGRGGRHQRRSAVRSPARVRVASDPRGSALSRRHSRAARAQPDRLPGHLHARHGRAARGRTDQRGGGHHYRPTEERASWMVTTTTRLSARRRRRSCRRGPVRAWDAPARGRPGSRRATRRRCGVGIGLVEGARQQRAGERPGLHVHAVSEPRRALRLARRPGCCSTAPQILSWRRRPRGGP